MNPNKKKESIGRVRKAYRQYMLDMIDYKKNIMDLGSSEISPNGQTPEEYYASQETKPIMVKPDIRFYLHKEDMVTLKNIIKKKRGY